VSFDGDILLDQILERAARTLANGRRLTIIIVEGAPVREDVHSPVDPDAAALLEFDAAAMVRETRSERVAITSPLFRRTAGDRLTFSVWPLREDGEDGEEAIVWMVWDSGEGPTFGFVPCQRDATGRLTIEMFDGTPMPIRMDPAPGLPGTTIVRHLLCPGPHHRDPADDEERTGPEEPRPEQALTCADCGKALYYCETVGDYFHIVDDHRCFLVSRGHPAPPSAG